MRLALIIAAPYTEAPGLPVRRIFTDRASEVAAALRVPSADYSVTQLMSDQGLPERLARSLEGARYEELLIYVAGYVGLAADGGPVLLQDGNPPSALRLDELRERAIECAEHSLFVVDGIVGTAIAGIGGGPVEAATHVAGRIAELFDDAEQRSSLFAAIAPWRKEGDDELQFTPAWLQMVERLRGARDERTRVTAAWVREGLGARRVAETPGTKCVVAHTDFCILPAELELELARPTAPPEAPAVPPPAASAKLPAFSDEWTPVTPEAGSTKTPEESAPPPAGDSPPHRFDADPVPSETRADEDDAPATRSGNDQRRSAEVVGQGDEALPDATATERGSVAALTDDELADDDRPDDELAGDARVTATPSAEAPPVAPELSDTTPGVPHPPAPQLSCLERARQSFDSGDGERAMELLRQALESNPDDVEAFEFAHKVLGALGEWDELDDLGKRHFACVPVGGERDRRYAAWIDFWTHDVADPERARKHLERWLENGFEAEAALSRLIKLAEHQGDYGTSAAAMVRLAAVTREGERQGELLANAAERYSSRLLDSERAIELCRRALAAAPENALALRLVRAHLSDQGRWSELTSLLEGLSPPTDQKVAHERTAELLTLYREHLHEPGRAARVIERALESGDGTPELCLEAAELHEDADDIPRAVVYARRALKTNPPDAKALHRARGVFHRAGDLDAAWQASTSLVLLREADSDERDLAAHFARTTLLTPVRPILEGDWPRLGQPKATVFDVMLSAVGPTAAGFKAAWVAKKRRNVEDPTGEDPTSSTTTLARTLVWTSRFLNVTTPALAVDTERTETVALLWSGDTAVALVNRALGRGHTLAQLSFLWARELLLLQPARRAGAAFVTPEELTQLVTAGLCLIGYADPGQLNDEGTFLFKKLKRRVSAATRVELQRQLAGVGVTPGFALLPDMVGAYRRQLALLQSRAGLLACGDLAVAADLVRRFPLPGASASEQWYDLISYANSEDFAVLRRELGIAVTIP